MALAAPLTLVLGTWMLVLAGHDRRWLVLAAVGASAATLAKGPVGLVIPALAAVGLAIVRRDRTLLRTLGVVPVLGAATLVAGAWYAAAFLQQGWAFLDVVLKENVARFVDTDESKTGHAHGLFYLPLLGLVGLLPWTPLALLCGPAIRRSGSPAAVLAAVWSVVVLGFFSIANAKRSVYLLPLYPSVAMLIALGATVASNAARRWASVYTPVFGMLGVFVAVVATGVDVTSVLARVLEHEDLHGAIAVTRALHTGVAPVTGLALGTLAAAIAIAWLRRSGRVRAVLLVVAVVFAAWTAVFQTTIHRGIGRERGVDTFLRDVDRLVPPGVPLGFVHPVHTAVAFYAPRPLVPIRPRDHAAVRHALLWEENLPQWQRFAGPLQVVAMSHNRPANQGRLVLVSFGDR
jgi:4-amino-4-deoxy-L-arabinose transferase-like glycosyltransferase